MEDPHEENCEVVLKGGTDIADSKLVFSADSKFIAGCSGSEVKVWSLASGRCVQRLKGHKGRVTCIALHPSNPYQLFSTCQAGMVLKWDFMDGVQLASFKTSAPCLALVPTKQSTFYALTGRTCDSSSSLVALDLNKNHLTEIHSGILPKENAIALGCQELFVAAVTAKSIVIHTLQKGQKEPLVVLLKEQAKNIRKSKGFCCVSTHPKEMCIATGMRDGKIILWWFCVTERKITTTKPMHWHSLAVNDIAFTPLGTNLLSGGHECVLVRWQYNGSESSYLPRLGSPITRVTTSHDNTLYAVCHADNSIQIISRDFKVVQVMQGLTLVQGHNHTGLILDPKSGSVVMNGRPGHLQFYHLRNDSQLFNLDIVGQNYISAENLRRPLVYTEVTRAAFSRDAQWLATIEQRIDGKTKAEIRLKFWKHDGKKQKFVLNTSVSSAHDCSVNDLCMRPDLDLQAVSTSADGHFKIWNLVNTPDVVRSTMKQSWSCMSVGFYRNLIPSRAVYSNDGSILAVAFDRSLTLWDPEGSELCESLSHQDPIQHLCAGVGSTAHLLISGTNEHVYAWNLLSCSAHWCIDMKPGMIVVNPFTEAVAVFTQDFKLKVLNAESSSVVFEKENVSPAAVSSAIFIPCMGQQSSGHPSWMGTSNLCFLTVNREFYALENLSYEEDDQESTKLRVDTPESTLTRILKGKCERKKDDEFDAEQVSSPSNNQVSWLLTTPAHVLPPVMTLCAAFLSQLMPSLKSEKKSDQEDDEEKEPDVMIIEVEDEDDDVMVMEESKTEVVGVTASQDGSSLYAEIQPQMFGIFT